jgi:hypothetical protein
MKPQGAGGTEPPADLRYREKWGPLDPNKPDGWSHSHLITEQIVDILSRVTSRHSERASSLEETAHDVHRVHSRIAEAILSGDVEAAERRMKRHLDSVVHFLHP